MSAIIYVTGGARSGKSRLAEEMAERLGERLCYVATGEPGDDEMRARIARHRERRGPKWRTIEEPIELTNAIRENDGRFDGILIDCVTFWLANMLEKYGDTHKALDQVASLAAIFPGLQTPLIVVSNEVGMGIVPENALARAFRDLAGEANELLAKAADEVYVMFSGLPVKLKG